MIWKDVVENLFWINCAWLDWNWYYIKRNCVLIQSTLFCIRDWWQITWRKRDLHNIYFVGLLGTHLSWTAGTSPLMICWDLTSWSADTLPFMTCWELTFQDMLGPHLSWSAGSPSWGWWSPWSSLLPWTCSPVSVNLWIQLHQICNTNDKLLEIETGAGTGYQITGPWG